jgi:O-antigen/teichoic acid export membrane protein
VKLRDLLFQITRYGAVYWAGELSGRLAGFLLIPLYTRVFLPADFGRLQILLALYQLGQMTADWGLSATFLRWFGLAKTEEQRRQVTTNLIAATLFTSTISVGLFLLISKLLSNLLLSSVEYACLVRLVVITVGLRVSSNIALTYLRLRERAASYSVFSLSRTLLSLLLVLYFVLGRRLGIYGILLGEAIASGVALIIGLFVLYPALLRRIQRSQLRAYLQYSIPFFFANLAAFGLLATDKFLLSAFGLAEETGFYSLAGKFGLALNVCILWPFTLVWNPLLFRIVRDEAKEEAQRLVSRIFTYIFSLLLWAALSLAVFAPELIDLVAPPAYAPAIKVTPFLILGYVVYGSYRQLQSGLYISGKSRAIAGSFALAAALNLVLNILLIPRLGMIGAASATLLSYIAMAGSILVAAQRHYPIPYEWQRVSHLLIWSLVLYAVNRLLLPTTGLAWPATPLKLIILAAYPIGVFGMRILTPGERQELARIVTRVARRLH